MSISPFWFILFILVVVLVVVVAVIWFSGFDPRSDVIKAQEESARVSEEARRALFKLHNIEW
jgi:uncharacterized protein (UPF0333 family)